MVKVAIESLARNVGDNVVESTIIQKHKSMEIFAFSYS